MRDIFGGGWRSILFDARLSRREVGLILVASILNSGCGTAPPGGVASTSSTVSPIGRPSPAPAIASSSAPSSVGSPSISGSLLTGHDGNFYTFDIATRKEAALTHFPKGTYGSFPTLSPDGTQLAYGNYVVPKDANAIVGSDLYLIDKTGTNARLLLSSGQPGVGYEDPWWTPDGKAIDVSVRTDTYTNGKFQYQSFAILQVPVNGSTPVSLVAEGLAPCVSADGKFLAYLTRDQRTAIHRLWIADANGQNPRALLSTEGFTDFASPRFSPDGHTLAFSAAGGPGIPTVGRGVPLETLSAIWDPSVAEADGVPWEVWSAALDGSGLRRLTSLAEDPSLLAWSPRGDWIACAGGHGFYLIEPTVRQTVRLSSLFSGAGLIWLPSG